MRRPAAKTWMSRLMAAHVIALTSLLLVTSAWATTLLKLDLDALISHSEQIVAAEVTEIKAEQVQGRIFTNITIKVIERFKGSGADTITFRQLGGRYGDLVTYVPGQPDFSVNERVLLFLERPSQGQPLVVTGMAQGKFKLQEDPATKQAYVVPALGHTPLLERAQIKDGDKITERLRQAAPSTDHSQVTTYSDFTTRLKQRIAAQRPAKAQP